MKRHTSILTLLIGVIALFSCQRKEMHVETNMEALKEAKISNDSLQKVYNQTLKEIDENLVQIHLRQNIVSISHKDNSEFSKTSKERIIENIKVINSLMEENEKKIAELKAALRKSKNKNVEWEDKVKALELMIGDRNDQIAKLKDELSNSQFLYSELNGQYTELELKNQLLSDSLLTTRNEMNEAYFAMGSYKELKKKGILEKEGGFIGIGRNKVLTDTFDNNYFSKVDIRDVKRIPVFSKKAEIITDHPADSYELTETKDEKMIAYLEIKKPDDFWKASRYMVIEVKK